MQRYEKDSVAPNIFPPFWQRNNNPQGGGGGINTLQIGVVQSNPNISSLDHIDAACKVDSRQ